jgi:hypothetical protein
MLVKRSWASLGEAQSMESGHAPTPIDIYRRRAQLRHALATVEAAIVLSDERAACGDEPVVVNLEGLREDLLVALWLTEVLLSNHR